MANRKFVRALTCSASIISFSAAIGNATIANAQETEASDDVIVITGVRASLDRSIDLKRNSNGVVDGISAEDIGKFPDTNLAESLQRVTGVSIDRVNGEGQKVTVRGFGPGYNLVTLNGRTLPTASLSTVGADQQGDFAAGTDRSFDFSNIASEGVGRLEVYKTARAAVTSGGIGAAINIVTRSPLDGPAGFSGTISAKGLYDGSDTIYDRITPEVSGLIDWANADGTFGVSLFGSWQRRNNSAPSLTVNEWNIVPYSDFADAGNSPFVKSDGSTAINNAPSDPDQLVGIPNDTRYEYSEFQRERINAHGTLEFRPNDALTVSVDGTYYQNRAKELRTDQTNWLNRPFDRVDFDGNDQVATAVYIDDIIGGVKDDGFEQQYRAVKERLWDVGAKVVWDATDRLTLSVDAHTGKGEALPDNPLGHTSTAVSIASHGTSDQQLAIVNGFPQQSVTFNDDPVNGGDGNANGVRDIGDLGSQVARSWTNSQSQRINEARFDGSWGMSDDNRVEFGTSYRDAKMVQSSASTYQALGDWGVANVGDVEQYAGDLVTPFCLTCQFKHFDPGSTGASLNAFRADATKLWSALGPQYDNFNPAANTATNIVTEKIWAAYVQVDLNTELLSRPVNVVAGVRYEHTDSTSTSTINLPQAVVWQADNDFIATTTSDLVPYSVSNSYEHILPALDFSIDLTDQVKGRISFGRTIARPSFGQLGASVTGLTDHSPGRPTALGGVATATSGNPNLVPLVSDNFDASLEWYFARSSYVSAGFFDKRVRNFVGTGQENSTLFGLTDPGSGAAGTRSGDALAYLKSINADLSDVNLFTMTALIDQFGLAEAQNRFQDNYNSATSTLSQQFVDDTLAAYDVTGNSADPEMIYQVQKPINNKEGHIWGFEVAGQYFLGNTGLGVTAAYTKVNGDIGYDITAPTNADQFALLGLSDTANVSLIYENYGISARLTYNWREKFLSNSSRGNYRNPVFVAPYHQFDLNISYDVTPHIGLSFEAINLTKEDTKTYARTENEPWFIVEGNARYLFGARFKF